MAELVLSVPMSDRGRSAIAHLQEHGERDLGCNYARALTDRLRSLRSAEFLQHWPHSFHLVRVADGDQVRASNRILRWHDGEKAEHGFVETAEPNVRLALSANQSFQFRLGGQHGAYLRQMRHNQVPPGSTGAGVQVVVVDSGLDTSAGITPSHFYDVESTPPGPLRQIADGTGHGTAMATLIREIAPGAAISVVQALDPTGNLPLWNLLAAIPVAVYDCHAAIINLSVGCAGFPNRCSICGATVQARLLGFDKMLEGIAKVPNPAVAGPPIYVAATGNEQANAGFNFPAFQSETVAVGAVTSAGVRSSFSNYGTNGHKWYLMAPGGEEVARTVTEDVGSVVTSQGSVPYFGTSVATAYVSGMLALLRSELRYRNMPRDNFLDKVVQDHCELAPGAQPIEYGSGQIVYVKAPAAAAVAAAGASTPAVKQNLTIEIGDTWVRIGGVTVPRRH